MMNLKRIIKHLLARIGRPFLASLHDSMLDFKSEADQITKQLIVNQLCSHYAMLYELSRSGEYVLTKTKRSPRLVVSLTSIPSRLHKVHLVVESLFRQSLPPDEIVLWLDEKRFSPESLPAGLRKQQHRGLTIRYCIDYGPHTKLLHALREYPHDLIATCDDDQLYPDCWLEKLYSAYSKEPEVIHCHLAHWMTFDKNGTLRNYDQWNLHTDSQQASLLIFPTGVGGVLYFPRCFDDEVQNHQQLIKLCPKADDIWFKAMTLRRGIRCRVLQDGVRFGKTPLVDNLCTIPGSQAVTLMARNLYHGENDSQLAKVFAHYQLNEALREEFARELALERIS